MTTLPKPQPTDGNPEAPTSTLVPTGRQASGGDLEVAPVVAGESSGGVQVWGELDTAITGGEDPPDPKPCYTSQTVSRTATPHMARAALQGRLVAPA